MLLSATSCFRGDKMRMRTNWILLSMGLAAACAGAQSAVTTTNLGTPGSVPVFTSPTGAATPNSTSNVENSNIFQLNGNIGIGTQTPTIPFVVAQPTSFRTAASIQYMESGQAVANTMILAKPPLLQIVGGADENSPALIGVIQPLIGTGSRAVLNFAGSRASVGQINSGTFSPLQSGDPVGVIDFGGDDGTNLRPSAAEINVNTAGVWSSTSVPTNMTFFTTPVGSTNIVQRMVINSAGNVGIGTTDIPAATLEVNGTAKFDSTVSVSSNGIAFAGSSTPQTTPWTGVLCGGDYAEAVKAAGKKQAYEPGDVLVLTSDTQSDVQKSSRAYSTMVAGIYATKPGVIGRRQSLKNEAEEVPMAMVGIVPTKVTAKNGPIHRGDLLVSSAVPGYAMKGTDRNRLVGAVIGKAMGSLDSGNGVIEVLVTLQ